MAVLRPITEPEFDAWLGAVIPAYADDKVTSGQWPKATALDLSRDSFAELLPEGKDTPEHHLFTILTPAGVPVGTLWFIEQQRANGRVAHVYGISIAPEHRRQGHASRALQALEIEAARLRLSGIALHVFGHNVAAQALYAKLGYVATNINMFKAVS